MAASSYDNFTAFYAQDPSVFGNTYETSVKIATVRLLDSQNNDTLNQKINAALHAIDTGQGDPESLINDLQAYVDDRFSAVGGPQLSPQEAVSYKHSHERGVQDLIKSQHPDVNAREILLSLGRYEDAMPEQDRAQLNNDTKAFTLFTNMLPADNSSQAKFLEAYDHMSTARTNIEQKYQGYDELQVLSHKIGDTDRALTQNFGYQNTLFDVEGHEIVLPTGGYASALLDKRPEVFDTSKPLFDHNAFDAFTQRARTLQQGVENAISAGPPYNNLEDLKTGYGTLRGEIRDFSQDAKQNFLNRAQQYYDEELALLKQVHADNPHASSFADVALYLKDVGDHPDITGSAYGRSGYMIEASMNAVRNVRELIGKYDEPAIRKAFDTLKSDSVEVSAAPAAPAAPTEPEPAKPASEPLVIHITGGTEMKLSGRMAIVGRGTQVVEPRTAPSEEVRKMQSALVAAGFSVGTYPDGHPKAGQALTDGQEGDKTRGAALKAAEAMNLTEEQLRTMPIEEFTQKLEDYKLKMEQKHGVVVPDSKSEGTQVAGAEAPLACPVEGGRSPYALDQILKQSPVGEIRELGRGTPQMCFTDEGQNMLIGGNPASENFQNFAVANPAVVEPPQSSPELKPDQEAPVVQNDTVTLRLA